MASVRVTGINDVLNGVDKRSKLYKQAADRGVVATASEIQREAILSINKQSPGERYERKNGRYHIASRRGDAPNTDKGRLVGSIAIAHVRLSQVAFVFTDLVYGAILELIKDRPFLRPAMDKKKGELKSNIENEFKKVNRQ